MVSNPHRAADWLFLVLGIAWVGYSLVPLYRSKSAGPVLLDVRSHDSSRAVLGVLMFALGLFDAFFASHYYRFQGFYWLGYGVFWMVASQRRFQIREAGILSRRLFRWTDVQEYYLSRDGGLALNLRAKGWRYVAGVPRQDRQRADELLSSRLPAQHVIDGF